MQGWPGPRIVSGPDRPGGPDEPVCLTAPRVDSSPSGGPERSRLAPERATAFKARRLRERPPGHGPLAAEAKGPGAATCAEGGAGPEAP
jgi:hypothetical protein